MRSWARTTHPAGVTVISAALLDSSEVSDRHPQLQLHRVISGSISYRWRMRARSSCPVGLTMQEVSLDVLDSAAVPWPLHWPLQGCSCVAALLCKLILIFFPRGLTQFFLGACTLAGLST